MFFSVVLSVSVPPWFLVFLIFPRHTPDLCVERFLPRLWLQPGCTTELNSSLFATIFEGPLERTDSLTTAKSVSRARARLRDVACYVSTHWFVPFGIHLSRNCCNPGRARADWSAVADPQERWQISTFFYAFLPVMKW